MTIENLKKIIFTIFLSVCTITSSIQRSFCNPTQKKSLQEKPIFSPLAQRVIFGILALEACYITGNEAVKKTLAEQCHPKKLVINFIWNYGITAFGTLIHELGHATAANLLNNDKLNIHLGSNSSDNNEALFHFGDSISIDGIDPVVGYSLFTTPRNKDRSVAYDKFGIIIAAGPLLGIAGDLALKTVLTKLLPNEKDFQLPWQANPIILNQLWNLLIPAGNNDAAQLYRTCFGMPQEIINNITKVTENFAFLTELYYLEATSNHPEQYGSHSKALLAFANWHLNGFLRFHL